jgi:hypothetical protein
VKFAASTFVENTKIATCEDMEVSITSKSKHITSKLKVQGISMKLFKKLSIVIVFQFIHIVMQSGINIGGCWSLELEVQALE